MLLVGAGRCWCPAAREIQNRGDLGLDICGFVDDNPDKLGSLIQGVRVLGAHRDLPRLVSTDVDHVVITIAKAPGSSCAGSSKICEQIPVKARIIPGLFEILDGSVEVSRIRDVEIEDLLGRDAVRLEDAASDFLAGKSVMVTGAGGSIGSNCPPGGPLRGRQRAAGGAGRVRPVRHRPRARQTWPDRTVVPLVADVGRPGGLQPARHPLPVGGVGNQRHQGQLAPLLAQPAVDLEQNELGPLDQQQVPAP